MFERFDTPEEIFSYKLGSALSMERQLVDLLERLEKCTLREEIRHPLAVHREETLQHIANIEHCSRSWTNPSMTRAAGSSKRWPTKATR